MGFSQGSDTKNKNTSTTVYPSEFLAGFQNQFGRGVGLDELLGGMPQAQSIFGGGGSVSNGNQVARMPGSPAAGGAANNGVIPFDVINSTLQSQYMAQPKKLGQVMSAIQAAAGPGATGITLDQLRNFQGAGVGSGIRDQANYITAVLPAQLSQFTQAPTNRFQPTAPQDLSALQIPQSIQRLFGQNANPQAEAPQFRDLPQIQAANMQSALANVAPGGFDQYQQALYRSMNDPVQRQLAQQGAAADRQMQAELAQSGLSSSGAGIGQLMTARRQRSEQSMSAAQQAAQQASIQRFGQEYQQAQFNAQQQQQANLQNANMNMEAQKQNVANILAGDTAKADTYLRAIGLNQQAASAMRNDFLNLLGVTQKELERLDNAQRSNIETALQNWLQQGALLGNLGQRGQQRGSTSGGAGGGLTITGQSFS